MGYMIDKKDFNILQGDALVVLKTLPDKSVQMCVTSPPYYALRDYGTATWEGGDLNCNHYRDTKYSEKTATGHKHMMEQGEAVGDAIYKSICPKCGAVRVDKQIGLEETPEQYIQKLVEVFHEVKRVLKDDGTLWINIGDTYNGTKIGKTDAKTYGTVNEECTEINKQCWNGAKNKDLLGIPWKLAEALKKPYYLGAIKNESDRVWLAATIDAEGSICGTVHNRKDNTGQRTAIFINITNTNLDMLDNAKRVYPNSTITLHSSASNPTHLGNRKVFRWSVGEIENKINLIREIYPYLIVKKKQAKVAYNFLKLQRTSKSDGHYDDKKEESNAKRKIFIEMLSLLNRGEDVDVSSLEEPTTLYEKGWWLRQDIIWDKSGNTMPESVKDRCTKAHEYIFLLSKSPQYLFNCDAIKEPVKEVSLKRAQYGWHGKGVDNTGNYAGLGQLEDGEMLGRMVHEDGRNKRDVWHINTNSYSGAHFATYPEELVLPCILAGSNEGDTVLDVFNGAATTGIVALKNKRKYIGIELNPKYIALSNERFNSVFNGLEPLSEPVVSEGMRKTDLLEDI